MILAVSLTALVGFAAWYHCRTLEKRHSKLELECARLRDDLAEERDLRHQADEAQAQFTLLLSARISEIENRRGQGLILFSHPRDRN